MCKRIMIMVIALMMLFSIGVSAAEIKEDVIASYEIESNEVLDEEVLEKLSGSQVIFYIGITFLVIGASTIAMYALNKSELIDKLFDSKE